MHSQICIRRAATDDLGQVAGVHVSSWHTTYAGIVAEDYLNQLSVEKSAERFYKTVSDDENPVFMYVADIGGEVVGFASGGPCRGDDLGFAGELYAIYILEHHQKQGIGRELTSAVINELCRRGMCSMLVWAFAENASARKFYEQMGGRLVAEKTVSLGNQSLDEVAYGWNNLKEMWKHQ